MAQNRQKSQQNSQSNMFGFNMFGAPQPKKSSKTPKGTSQTINIIGIPESSFFGFPQQKKGKKKKGKPPQQPGILGGIPSIFG